MSLSQPTGPRPAATFCPKAREVDPRHFVDLMLSDPLGQEKLPELADDAFHPSQNPQVAATLDWASRQGQAILVGDADGDFDVMHCQVHLNLEAPMLGERFAPYGHLHLMLHDLTHHYLGQIRVRPEDVATEEGLLATRKKIHQAAMLGELVASFTTVSRIIPAYSNWRSEHLGEGRAEQYGGFFSFAKDERAVVEGWKALYGGGEIFSDFIRRELSSEIVADYRAAGDWLVWPSLPFLLRAFPRFRNQIARFEAWAMPKVLPRLLPWAYWNRSVYSVASFQADCRHLAERYTSPWHMRWQADFDHGASFEEVIERCHRAFRGVAGRDFSFFSEPASDDLAGGDYTLNVRRQQVRHFARKLYELEHELRAGQLFQGSEAARASWLELLAEAGQTCRDLFHGMSARDACQRYADEFLPLRERVLARQAAEAAAFRVAPERSDFLANPNRQLEDPGVRDANSKAPQRKSWRQRWSDFKAGLRALFGAKVVAEEREWVLEIYAGLDHEAVFDALEARGIPTAGREVPPSVAEAAARAVLAAEAERARAPRRAA